LGGNAVEVLTADDLWLLHTEVYRNIIRGFCMLENITQKNLATRIGISEEHLSYVLHGRRNAGPRFQWGIEDSKRLLEEFKDSVLSNIWAAAHYQKMAELEFLYQSRHQSLSEVLAKINTEYTTVTWRKVSEQEARTIYNRIWTRCSRLTSDLARIQEDPLTFARLCTMQADVGHILGKPYASLKPALLAEAIMDSLDRSDFPHQKEEFDHIKVNAVRVPGILYQALHLHSRAYGQFEKVQLNQFVRQRPDIWRPHMARDKLDALSGVSRFGIRDAEQLAGKGKKAWYNEVLYLLVELSLARCYTNYGSERSLKKSKQMLRRTMDDLGYQGVNSLTPLHKAMFYTACADLERKINGKYPNYQNRTDIFLYYCVRAAWRMAKRGCRIECTGYVLTILP